MNGVVAGPVNPQGRILVSTWKRAIFMPPRTLVKIQDMPLGAKEALAQTSEGGADTAGKQPEPGDTRLGTGSITSTGICFAWAVTEVDSVVDFPKHPPEPAGPLLASSSKGPTLDGTPGSICLYFSIKDRDHRAWVLHPTAGQNQWVQAKSGAAHPNQDALRGYRLNLRNPRSPSWVPEKTYKAYSAPSKQVQWWLLK